MEKILIRPLFNLLRPDIWHDFARIYCAANRYGGRCNRWDIDSQRSICVSTQQVRQKHLSFAFGAYDNSNMVGYIIASGASGCGYIDALHVLPEYQRHGIARTLLSTTEAVFHHYAKTSFVVSSSAGEPFYKARGYSEIMNFGSMFYKNLVSRNLPNVMPLFHCDAALTYEFKQIDPAFNPDLVNNGTAPAFAYFASDAVPGGYIVQNPGGGDVIMRTNPQLCDAGAALWLRAVYDLHIRAR